MQFTGTYFFMQERFKLQGRENSTDDSKWWIPVTFTSQSEKKFDNTQPRLWFRDVKSLPDPAPASEWFMLNLQAAGNSFWHKITKNKSYLGH